MFIRNAQWWTFVGWDKCRRLEEAIMTLILESGWDIEIILQIATSEHRLYRLVRRADDYYRARKLLWKLGDLIKEETVKANKWQKKILASYCK